MATTEGETCEQTEQTFGGVYSFSVRSLVSGAPLPRRHLRSDSEAGVKRYAGSEQHLIDALLRESAIISNSGRFCMPRKHKPALDGRELILTISAPVASQASPYILII